MLAFCIDLAWNVSLQGRNALASPIVAKLAVSPAMPPSWKRMLGNPKHDWSMVGEASSRSNPALLLFSCLLLEDFMLQCYKQEMSVRY